MRDKKISDCVEQLWVSTLFRTKQHAASSLMYRSEEWVLRTINQFGEDPSTDFHVSFLSSLLHG